MENTRFYKEMVYPTIHIIYPSKTVSKRNCSYLHEILTSVYADGYSYTIQAQDEHIYVFLNRKNTENLDCELTNIINSLFFR
jgi:hypothetical protein